MSGETGVPEVRMTSRVFYVSFSDGSKAFLRYRIEDGKLLLVETYTPPQHRGKGIARLMVEKALEVAREKGLQIVPICSYSVYYFIKNPDKRGILAEPYRSMSDDELKRYYQERLEAEKSKEK
ncbi:MAG: N-acetyltransferase [Aeropyrum sp.]|nr:N-acetyltransferase [Aeropyrum sp.]MCE4615686.1 N-acetyltransferase [Aeropyrum sp.]